MARANQKHAIVIAATVEVHCPACDAEQPCAGNGSDLWTIEELRHASGRDFTCVSCDHAFVLNLEHKVNLP